MENRKRAKAVVKTALVLLVGFVAGDFMSQGLLYRKIRSAWYREQASLRPIRGARASGSEWSQSGAPEPLSTTIRAPQLERQFYARCPAAYVKVMDETYTNLSETQLQKLRKKRGGGTGRRNVCESKGDCDEAARIMLGWAEERYPGAAAGLICGKLRDGRTHAELVFWDGEFIKTFSPRTATAHFLKQRFRRIYLIIM